MQHPGFFQRSGPMALAALASAIKVDLAEGEDGGRAIEDVRSLETAGAAHLTFFENRKYADQLGDTKAGACILASRDAFRAPHATARLTTAQPYEAFARAVSLFYKDSFHSKAASDPGAGLGRLVHPTAELAEGVTIEPGAVVGREARIGPGTTIAAGAVIGFRVVLGRDCYVGPTASLMHTLAGDGVIIHSGARIGQDGFGFAMSARGHHKVPQIGRVTIGDGVEIGANSTIDRGSLSDTVIGEGTKIDNLVQIAHNVVIGRHCVLVAQSGIAGSTQLGDFVVMGAKSGIIGHVTVGSGAQIAAAAQVKDPVEAGARMGGAPAKPFRIWSRELAALTMLGRRSRRGGDN